MKEFRADLHSHSIYSDGTDTPFELIDKAKNANLSGLSITDHDTIGAYSEEVFSYARASSIQLLTGVEISSETETGSVHILGYGFDIFSKVLNEFLEEMQRRREKRNATILKKLKEKKMEITEKELFDFSKRAEIKKSVGRPHIAALMVQKGYVNSFQDAFQLYLKEGASCFVPGFKYTPKEVIELLHEVKAKAVLAHPHFFKKGKFLKELLSLPFDGVECYYGILSKDVERKWLDLARERKWIATGGSDYHGSFKPHIQLGASYVTQETFNTLLPSSH